MSDFAGETQKGDKTTADGRLLALAILAAGWRREPTNSLQRDVLVESIDILVCHVES